MSSGLRDQLMAECERLKREEKYDSNIGYSYWDTDHGELACGTCTNAARIIANKFNGYVAGYRLEGDEEEIIGADCFGHDFAVVGGYIVDWWAWQYPCTLKCPVVEIADDLTWIYYLPQSKWKIVADFRRKEQP